jgi:hypothetical protein
MRHFSSPLVWIIHTFTGGLTVSPPRQRRWVCALRLSASRQWWTNAWHGMIIVRPSTREVVEVVRFGAFRLSGLTLRTTQCHRFPLIMNNAELIFTQRHHEDSDDDHHGAGDFAPGDALDLSRHKRRQDQNKHCVTIDQRSDDRDPLHAESDVHE